MKAVGEERDDRWMFAAKSISRLVLQHLEPIAAVSWFPNHQMHSSVTNFEERLKVLLLIRSEAIMLVKV
jgi:hypothetical protein